MGGLVDSLESLISKIDNLEKIVTTPNIILSPTVHEIANMQLVPSQSVFFKANKGSIADEMIVYGVSGFNPSEKSFYLCFYEKEELKYVTSIEAQKSFEKHFFNSSFKELYWSLTPFAQNQEVKEEDFIYLTLFLQHKS